MQGKFTKNLKGDKKFLVNFYKLQEQFAKQKKILQTFMSKTYY